MKIRELIEKLKTFDPEMPILCYTEETSFVPKGHGFRLFEIEAVDFREGERGRAPDGVPSITFGKSAAAAEKIAFLHVTGEF